MDHREHLVSFAQYFVAGNPRDSITLLVQRITPRPIPPLSGFGELFRPVDFEDQFQLDAAGSWWGS